MDFLDPRKVKAHRIRLIIGYVMVTLLIVLATIVLIYDTYGYGIDTKTGISYKKAYFLLTQSLVERTYI